MLVFESLFSSILEQGVGPETLLLIEGQKSFGEIKIRIGFEGAVYVPVADGEEGFSLENKILRAYDDKTDYSYHTGYNNIVISVKRSYSNALLFCAIGLLLALVTYLPLRGLLNADTRLLIRDEYVVPIERLFTNAMLMVGAPMTFFSLLKNLTDTYIVAERSSNVRKLQKTTISPFPLIIEASLATYAFCSVGKYFDRMKKAIDACYTLFSKMLNVVMFTLPVFCFIAFMDILLGAGFRSLLSIIILIALIIASLVSVALFYLIRLKVGGVPIRDFVKKLMPLIRENIKINSAIDAAPFNVRYCARSYGWNRHRMEETMPVLAQINLDGNCYLIMMVAMILIAISRAEVSILNIVVIGALVLFLSLGAPNQPGSILIGVLIITQYLHAYDLLPITICMEVFLGMFQNIINVVGDVVTMAIVDKSEGA